MQTVEINLPPVVIRVIPQFIPMRRRYKIMQFIFGLTAIEGEEHDFRMKVINKSTIAFDGGTLNIIQFVIPSITGSGVIATRGAYPIGRLAAGDEMLVDFGAITFRSAGNAEMTLNVDSHTQVVFVWYQKQWSGDALINVNVTAKSNVYWLAITALNVVAAFVNLFFTILRHST